MRVVSDVGGIDVLSGDGMLVVRHRVFWSKRRSDLLQVPSRDGHCRHWLYIMFRMRCWILLTHWAPSVPWLSGGNNIEWNGTTNMHADWDQSKWNVGLGSVSQSTIHIWPAFTTDDTYHISSVEQLRWATVSIPQKHR